MGAQPPVVRPAWPPIRVFLAISGGILDASGAITAYANTLGTGNRWVPLVLGGIGTLQLIVADVMAHLANG